MAQSKLSFTAHPHSVGESYSEHFVTAGGFGVRLLWAGIACLLHAVLPFVFERTGSKQITLLHARMVSNRSRHQDDKEHKAQAAQVK
jgi:Family of unknown function (DUF6356)